MMKFGVSLIGVSPRHYAEFAQIVENAGFESIWIPEHLVFPSIMPPQYPYTDDDMPPVPADMPLYDPWAVLGYLACATTKMRLATNIYITPLRHPLVTARSLATVDRLSGGRVTLGAGIGWLDVEYDALGVPFKERGARMDEIIPLLRRLWSEPDIEHHGRFYDFGPVKFEPKPIQNKTGGLPIELGGASPAALKRAGRLGDGWIEIGAKSEADLAAKLEVVNQARIEAGRENQRFEVTSGVWLLKDAQSMRRGAEMGVTRVLASPPMTGAATTPDAVEKWAREFSSEYFS
jgi:probable F420-dependent oxidoreductase